MQYNTIQYNTIHPEIIVLVSIFECRIQILRAFVIQYQATKGKIITIQLVIWLRLLFKITHLKIR
jgi:hypothetical protein